MSKEWLFRNGRYYLACVPTGQTAPPTKGTHQAFPLSPTLFPPLPKRAPACISVCLDLGKMSWKENFSGAVMWLLCGRCSNTKWNWNHEKACFSETLPEWAGKLDMLAPAQASLHEGRGTVRSGWISHPCSSHSHHRPLGGTFLHQVPRPDGKTRGCIPVTRPPHPILTKHSSWCQPLTDNH